MTQAKNGDTVKVHYTGTLNDGTEFDSSREGDPLEFTLGENQVIAGFENAVIGMTPQESKTVQIPSDDAYGPRQDNMVAVVERNQFPDDISLEIGQQLNLQLDNDRTLTVRVADMSDEKVTLDGNHPLAGEDLNFEIELVDIA